ncbi:hypothetical protein [Prauserella muralis]|uniref:Uncharacterized protein n=1 Tax=Prauserella muralis TaxID=588067 RepID=A0A2V4BA53_9PSEU|nr:hypothetical protein [Prauserella muralis]PXY32158.1 hypothetical protein BAY60_07655 [Prauserella muralis]TWE24188.1 hypothetical protein FHX69_5497 [Prauserella muralis]
MGHVVEQRPDGEPGPEQRPPGEPAPGSEIEPAQQSAPAESGTGGQQHQAPPQLDPEQLRQFEEFQQFQRFQEFQRFQQGQQPPQPGGELAASRQHHPAPTATQQLIPQQPPRPPRKVPSWLQWLGKKVLGWLIFFILLAIALTWAYNYFIGGSDDSDSPESQAQLGGQKLEKNFLMEDDPYGAVRFVYDNIAQNLAEDACQRFDYPNGADQKFAQDLGYSSCREAVTAINRQLASPDDYAEAIPSGVPTELFDEVTAMRPGATIKVDSCDATALRGGVKGGPALGTFVLTKQKYKSQWLITGHEPGPKTCPATPSN